MSSLLTFGAILPATTTTTTNCFKVVLELSYLQYESGMKSSRSTEETGAWAGGRAHEQADKTHWRGFVVTTARKLPGETRLGASLEGLGGVPSPPGVS